jgi:hypothetical protein
MSRERFVEFLKEAIVALPQHLKEMLRLSDDPDLSDQARRLAAGALLHWLSGTNTIPGARGDTLPYVDDVLVLRLVYERIAQLAPEVMSAHKASAPELFGSLEDELALMRDYLGEGMSVIEKGVNRLSQIKHVGRTAEQCVGDEECATMLYEDVQAALVDLDLEEEEVARALKSVDPLIASLK